MWVLGGAVGVVAVWSWLLVRDDERRHRLPDHLTLPAALGATLGALATHPALLLGGVVWAGVYLLGRGIGGGDVKLALSLGVVAAAAAGAGGVILAAGVSSAVTVGRFLHRRGRGGGVVPHGLSMLVGAFSAVCVGAISHPG